MATPQESVTTVSGRRCTRSRVRTAAPSIATSEAAAPPVTTQQQQQQQQQQPVSSIADPPPAQQVQTSAAIEAPPPPPPSSTPAPAPSSTGTDSPVLSSAPQPAAQPAAPFANVANSPLVAEVPTPAPPVVASPTTAGTPTAVNDPAVAADALTTGPPPALAPTSSDSINTAAISTSPAIAISAAPVAPVAPVASLVQSSADPTPEQPTSTATPFDSLPTGPPSAGPPGDPPTVNQPNDPQPTPSRLPSGGAAGIISPEQGGDGPSLTIGNSTGANIGGIVGGVVGGLLGLILICGLLFFCLRKRKSREPFEKWQQRISEKDPSPNPGFLEKLQAIPASVALFFAGIGKKKTEPAQHPYKSTSARSSISSVYSTQTNGGYHNRSASEPPVGLRQQIRNFGTRIKRSKTGLQKRQDSFVVGSTSPFKGIVQDPVARNNKAADNPFADPEPLEPPRNLFVLNPDPNSSENSPNLQREFLDGLRDQQRAPIAPKPATLSDRGSRDPLASIMDQLGEYDGSGTPEWLRDPHKRSHSATTALASHPPSAMYTPSIYASADNPFLDPSDVPPVPSQPLPPNPPIRPTNAYPAFNPTASDISRASNSSFIFGEPGPSRPATRMFAAPPRKPGRQSDPFDLDRPEVLGFGNVSGRREVRASTVTRQNSRRRSSVPNWVNMQDGPYERSSAVPGPLRNPSVKR